MGNPRGSRDALAATRLPRREPTVQPRTDPELRIRPQFKLPDWLLLASWSFGGLFSSFPTIADRLITGYPRFIRSVFAGRRPLFVWLLTTVTAPNCFGKMQGMYRNIRCDWAQKSATGTRCRTQRNLFESTRCVRSDADDVQQVKRGIGARERGREGRADARRVHADARASSRRRAERGRLAGSGLPSSSKSLQCCGVAARPPSVARATGRPPRPRQLRAGLSHGRGRNGSCAVGRVLQNAEFFKGGTHVVSRARRKEQTQQRQSRKATSKLPFLAETCFVPTRFRERSETFQKLHCPQVRRTEAGSGRHRRFLKVIR